jgi:uncharacterized coiled-coil DUF342 family protein
MEKMERNVEENDLIVISEQIKPMRNEIRELDKLIDILVDRRNSINNEISEIIRKKREGL